MIEIEFFVEFHWIFYDDSRIWLQSRHEKPGPAIFTIWNPRTRVLKSIMKIYYHAEKTLFHPIWHFTLTYAKFYNLLASWQIQI